MGVLQWVNSSYLEVSIKMNSLSQSTVQEEITTVSPHFSTSSSQPNYAHSCYFETFTYLLMDFHQRALFHIFVRSEHYSHLRSIPPN